MSLGDIVGRTDALLGKYGKYDEPDPERGPSGKEKGKGAFNGLFAQLQSDCEALEQVPPLRPRPSPPPPPPPNRPVRAQPLPALALASTCHCRRPYLPLLAAPLAAVHLGRRPPAKKKKKAPADPPSPPFRPRNLQPPTAAARLHTPTLPPSQKARDVEGETNRAAIATMNAELRRGKNAILTGDVPRLEKLAAKRGKGVTKEIVAERQGMVRELVRQIQGVPDGVSSSIRNFRNQQAGRAGGGLELSEIRVEERGGGSSGVDMSTTEQSEAFALEWDERKKKQEESLNVISQGLNTLKSMAGDIGEEIDRQDPLLREIEKKVR